MLHHSIAPRPSDGAGARYPTINRIIVPGVGVVREAYRDAAERAALNHRLYDSLKCVRPEASSRLARGHIRGVGSTGTSNEHAVRVAVAWHT